MLNLSGIPRRHHIKEGKDMDTIGLHQTRFKPDMGSGGIVGFISTIDVLFCPTSVGAAILSPGA